MEYAPFREGERGETGTFSLVQEQGRSMPMPESLGWAVVIFTLCVADAMLTIGHVSHGARELNPLMAHLLAVGPLVFLTVKLALSLGALTALAAFLPRYRCARTCFGAISVLYTAVCCYHLTVYVL